MFAARHTASHRNRIVLLLAAALSPPAACGVAVAQMDNPNSGTIAGRDPRLNDFQVFEFRRYTIKAGERSHFATYFNAWFPDAFQQVGAVAAGSFLERGNPNGFTWIRGFHTMDDRAVANAAFYYGPVWREHKETLNDLMTDSDNVLLLRPLSPERGVMVLPAVDPVTEPNGAQGVIVAQIFSVKKDGVEAFAKEAETAFAKYRSAGAREAGVLVTLDAKNNFPQLPIRTDGPFLVWLGILRDDQALDKDFLPITQQAAGAFTATGLLRGTPELIVLDPTTRSRLRWLPSWK
jgi:NIPSNAP